MESFKEILAVGGKANTLGRANEIVTLLNTNSSRLDELFDCIFDDDAWVRMRAIDSFEKLVRVTPGLAQPYLQRIFDELTLSEQPSIQWHLAQIFTEAELTKAQQNQAITWLKNRLQTSDVDWIVSVNTMKALVHFKQLGFVTAEDLKELFTIQGAHSSKSVRKKATTFQQQL